VRVLTVFVGDNYNTSSGFLQEKYAVIGRITHILPLIRGNNKPKRRIKRIMAQNTCKKIAFIVKYKGCFRKKCKTAHKTYFVALFSSGATRKCLQVAT
jgi:hypothetical protein